MKNLVRATLTLWILWPGTLLGQETAKVLQPENAMVRATAQRVSPLGTVYFQKGLAADPELFLEVNKSDLGLSPADELRPVRKAHTKSGGEMIHRFQQYHRGIPVEGAEYVLQTRNGELVKLKGRGAEGLDVDISRAMPVKQALEIAYQAVSPRDRVEKWWSVDTPDNGPGSAEGQAIIIRRPTAETDSYVLAFVFELPLPDSTGTVRVFVDAVSGVVLKEIGPRMSNAEVGTVLTLYNGTRSFSTRSRGWPNNDFVLQDRTRGEITTKNNPFIWGLGSQVTDGDNLWSHNEASAHWAVQKSHDYFKDVHFRNGIDHHDKEIRVYAKAAGSSFSDYRSYAIICLTEEHTTLDIAGHEFTHGVIRHTANLLYERESGALNESFADIFGTLTERQFRGGFAFDWLLAGEATTLRNMQDPQEFDQPDTFDGEDWFDLAGCAPSRGNDQCGIHTNSGVQNRWFSLLVDGDDHNGITVNGIGAVAAGRIAYRNLTAELFAGAGHQDAREGAIDAAEALYGECSNEVRQVTNAWAAVGVGDPLGTCVRQLFGSIQGDAFGEPGSLLSWTAVASGGVPPYSYSWRVNGSWAGGDRILSQFFGMDGIYFIEVTINDSSGQTTTAATSVVVGSCDHSPDCTTIQ